MHRSTTRVVCTAIAMLVLACAPRPPGVAPDPGAAEAFKAVAEADRLAARDLWPGFDPRAAPIAVYDGRTTFLFRHPAPSEGFAPVPGRPGVSTYVGRHPLVRANSSAGIGGVATATLMLADAGESVRERAGVLIHEIFHVFQRRHHPGWTANEVELFTYPVDDARLLSLRRMETEALRRVLHARTLAETTCWARAATGIRGERFAALPAGAAAYERGSEMNEGLAAYVQHRATGAPDSSILPADDFPPEHVRQRTYATGAAIGRVLDRLSPRWRAELQQADSTSLDVMLSTALRTRPVDADACGFAPVEREAMERVARAEVEALRSRRMAARAAFLAQPGWTLVVAAAPPLFPQGFDPLNVEILSPAEVLHSRFLKLGSDSGILEVVGRGALTTAHGAHPLFEGVASVILTGLPAAPEVAEEAGAIALRADGIEGRFRGATVERTGQTVTVRLGP